MFPYIDIGPIDLKVLELQPFGILLATGVLFGSYMGRRFLDKYNMDEDTSRWYVFRIVVASFILSHLVNSLLYEPGRIFDRSHENYEGPLLLVKVWDGISSYGGIIGAVVMFSIIVTWWGADWNKGYQGSVPRDTFNRERWMDFSVYALTPGYWFGRMGCSVVHDHIGAATDFVLSVDFPPGRHRQILAGGTHHDLGLYEALFLMPAIWFTILLIGRMKTRRDGLIAGVAGIMYAVPRFFLDYLRFEDSDPRYFGLTPAQYFSLILFTLCSGLLYKLYIKKQFTRVNEGDGGYLPAGKNAAQRAAKRAGKETGTAAKDKPESKTPAKKLPTAKKVPPAKKRPAKKKKKKPKK